MKAKPVRRRALADQDVEGAIDHYIGIDTRIADAFVDELERALKSVGSSPKAGSPRYATELDIQGLRAKQVKRYPYLIFYIEQDDHVDVLRVLHQSRDIPAHPQSTTDP